MRLPTLVIAIITVWGLWLLAMEVFGDIGESNVLYWLFLGILLTASIGFVSFRVGRWSGTSRAIFHARQPSLHPGASALQMTLNSIWALTCILGIIIAISVIVLEYYGQHDVVVAIGEFLASKTMRLINALMHD